MTRIAKRRRVSQNAANTSAMGLMPTKLDDVNVTEILDRVLDQGIVMEPASRVSLIGKNLQLSGARLVIESITVYS